MIALLTSLELNGRRVFFPRGSYDQHTWWFKKNSRRSKNLRDLSSGSLGVSTGAITLIIHVFSLPASCLLHELRTHSVFLKVIDLVVIDNTQQHNGSMQYHSDPSLPPP